ncbi:hypothetical protein CJD36_021590 [Flavipsychrobacter stenotrophus]|uniref:Secretion system C-terminal sorting domain-containing protein n=1 Tax=Flavipsychrobacter stenotrophus TaxID=2077091 RepID=A0A2S7SQU5_9BACT|nr:T9SS type A sorting domain-containing protein [Flavipsychrobacter stenotrophus]PQJ09001.1 hypothetical protein CJD36_021590 [Flavipsychrobacter stenotrophus]
MKKINLLLTIFLFFTLASHAQFKRTAHENQHSRLITTLLSVSSKKTAEKSTYTSERLVSTTNYGYDPTYGAWHRWDTTAYKYTGGRTSAFDFNSMRFLPYTYQYGYGPSGFDLGYIQVVSKNFSNKPSLQYSSAKTWDNYSSISDTTHIEYNANNDVVFFSDTSVAYIPGEWGKAFNQYDAAGRIILSTYVKNGSYQNDTVMRYYFYNGAGDLVRDSTLSFSFGYSFVVTKNEYAYNSANNISQIRCYTLGYPVWYETSRYTIAYYNSQQLKKVTMNDMTYGSYYWVDSFGWTSGIDYYTYSQTYIVNYDTFVAGRYIETKSVSPVTLLPDSVTYTDYYFGGSHPDTTIWKYTFEFDSYGMPFKRDAYEYNPAYITTDSLISTTYFHYKPNTTDVSIVPAENAHIAILPNPTSGIFTLQWPHENEDAEVAIYDITGKLILTKSISNASQITIDLTDQPSGNYVIKITGGNQIFRDRVVIW